MTNSCAIPSQDKTSFAHCMERADFRETYGKSH